MTLTDEAVPPLRPTPLTLIIRVGLLTLAWTVLLAAPGPAGRLVAAVWCGLLTVAAVISVLTLTRPVVGSIARVAEVCLVIAAAVLLDDPYSATLPYLVMPVLVTALHRGMPESYALVGLAAVVAVVSGLVTDRLTEAKLFLPVLQWLCVAAAAAGLGTWLRSIMRAPQDPPPYAQATRLLTQLRTVARQLPGGTLDPGGIAEHLLEEVRAAAPADRGAVLGASGGGRLVVLAQHGSDRVDWETSLDADTPIAEAWASQQPQLASHSLSRSRADSGGVSALIVPLVAGVRTVGLVVVEADRPGAFPPSTLSAVTQLVAPAALRLEAALLFDEVRSLATNEERQRLAREIHDGVAQELVMVGYGIDNALAQLPPEAESAAEELRAVRNEVTRVITELRLSLFELRSEVDRHGGLASAIADYARMVAASSGLRVHFSLDESTARLPAAVEAELLRIAQEAITNARKHAQASNLWISCEVDPPYARVVVSDDGQGIDQQQPEGRYGLAIMAERAERIRGQLEIRNRHPRGTTVAVALGTPHRRDNAPVSKGVNGDNGNEPGPERTDQSTPR